MPVITIASKAQFDDLIKSTPYVALQASAVWCSPCAAISPVFATHADAVGIESTYAFAKFDTDDVPDLAIELGVRSVPVFYFFENGSLASARVAGADPSALKKAVEELAEKAKVHGSIGK